MEKLRDNYRYEIAKTVSERIGTKKNEKRALCVYMDKRAASLSIPILIT